MSDTSLTSPAPQSESDQILGKFYYNCCPQDETSHREYLHYRLIFGLKLAISSIQTNSVSVMLLQTGVRNKMRGLIAWQDFSDCYFRYHSFIQEELVLQDNSGFLGSAALGQIRMQHVQRILAAPEARELLYYYVDLIFAVKQCETLVAQLGVQCCRNHDHTLKCEIKWTLLKRYFNTLMVENFGLEPWLPAKLPFYEAHMGYSNQVLSQFKV